MHKSPGHISNLVPNPTEGIINFSETIDKLRQSTDSIGKGINCSTNNAFNNLSEESQQLVKRFQESCSSHENLVSSLVKRVANSLKPELSQSEFNNIFQKEAMNICAQNNISANKDIIAGLMISSAALISSYTPEMNPILDSLILGADSLAEASCMV